MKWDDFKNKFRRDIHQQNVEVDIDSIWDAIESDVDTINKKKKRRFFFWMFFLGIGLASGIGFYILIHKNTSAIVDGKIDVKENIEFGEISQSTDSQEFNEARMKDKEIASTSIIKEKKITNSLNDLKINNKSDEDLIEKKVRENLLPSKNQSYSNAKKVKSSESKSEWSPNPRIKTKVVVEENKTDFNTSSSHKITSGTRNKKTQLVPLELSSAFLLLNISNSKSTSISIGQSYASSVYQKELEKEWKLKQQEEAEKPSKRKKDNLNFSAEIFGGLSFINRKIEAKAPSSNDLLNIRKDNEYTLESSYLGLHLNLKTKKGIYFTSGIQRTVIAEQYEINNTLTTMDSIIGVKTLIVNLTGDTIQRMGMLPRTTTSVLEKKIFNTYQLIDIPIFIGYESVKEKWALGIEAGVLANISLKTKGIIPNQFFDDINIATQQDEIFKSKIGLSYHLGLTTSRKIYKSLWLTFTPSLRILPSDITNDNYGLSQKYTLFGARVGVRCQF